MSKFNEANQYLNELYNFVNNPSFHIRQEKSYFLLAKAIINKKLKKYREATNDYKILEGFIN